MRVLSEAGGFSLGQVEDTWNMGIGMVAVVEEAHASAVVATLQNSGHEVWQIGVVRSRDGTLHGDAVTNAKGVEGGAIRLVGGYADSSSASS
jgi:phosphoribosylformylglycinamidine cyclo-ligase